MRGNSCGAPWKENAAFPIPPGEGAAHERLALAPVIRPGRIDVVHAAVDGVPQLPGGAFLVDAAVLQRQPHAPETENRQLVPGLRSLPIKHESPWSKGYSNIRV